MTAGDEIRNLLGLYCERIDAGDFAGVGELFEHGSLATDSGDELARGAAGVAAFYAARHEAARGGAAHQAHRHELGARHRRRARRATARSSYLVLQQVGGAPLQPIITGRYHDTFERHAERWRFSERRFFVDLVGDLSQHLAYTIG